MSNHTPGPWGVWHDAVYAGPFERISGGIRGYRAQICQMDDLDIEDDEVEANARLISSAPDLLALAYEALGYADGMEGMSRNNAEQLAHELAQLARAVIAKATGADQ